jgi:hypothetical protein
MVLVPTLAGVIERRVLANYRLDPDVTSRILPAPFRPQLFDGWAIGGICLIRLASVRPRGVCDWVGIRSENAAHRFAVEWDHATEAGGPGEVRTGVYIPRRDTDSRLNHWAGGRLFPGIHHLAEFTVDEDDDRVAVDLVSEDGLTRVGVAGRVSASLPATSVFGSLERASAFFAAGSLGYSETEVPGQYHGLELACTRWHCQPLAVDRIHSSFFEDPQRFPVGATQFDHALLMRDIDHEWIGRAPLCG